MLLLFLLNGLAFAGTNNWCPNNLQEQNCFACSGSGSRPDFVGNTCRVCEKGYVHFKKGDPCITAASLSSQVQASVTAENIVFMQSSSIYNAYKDIWSSSSDMYANKFYLQKAIAAVFVEKYGDNVDFAYITSHQYEGGCTGYSTASACNDRALCNWSSSLNECKSTGGAYPHQYENFWPDSMFDQMLGTIFWQPSFESMSGAFGTHFHEMGHHWLVHWNQYSQKNNWPTHQGTTGMERWGMMGGFDKSTITCNDPEGQSVTSSKSCNSSGGQTYLRFPAEKGTSQFQTSDTFGTAQYSDWELFAMGMKSVEDMGSQTMMHCWASGQMERYPSTGTLEGHIIPCTEVNFYTAQQLKDADWSWREPKSTFSAAHIILIPDDVTLPTDFQSMPAKFQKLSNWLKDDLPGEFVKATRGAGTITYRFSDAADDDSTNEPVASCPTACVAALADPANKASICSGDTSPYPCSLMDAQTHALNCLAEITTALTACIPTGDCPTDCAAAIAEPANKDSICSGDKENLVLPSPCTQMDGMVCSSEVYAACMGGGGDSTECKNAEALASNCEMVASNLGCDRLVNTIPNQKVTDYCARESCDGLTVKDVCPIPCNNCPGDAAGGGECPTDCAAALAEPANKESLCGENEDPPPSPCTEMDGPKCMSEIMAVCSGSTEESSCPTECATAITDNKASICSGDKDNFALPSPCTQMDIMSCYAELMTACMGIAECPTECAAAVAEPANEETLCGDSDTGDNPFPSPCTLMDGIFCSSEMMAVCGMPQGDCDDTTCGDKCEDMPTTCAELKDMVTKANGCASSCSQCMVDLFNERLECTGNNRVVVEQPAADKKVVKFEVTLSISKADYETHKDQIKKDFATILDTTTDKITITVVSRRARRLLTESVKLEVAVKAADADAASAIETKVKGDSFETDLAKEITDNTAGLNVEVTGVSEPKSENLTTTTDDDDSNNTTMIIIIVVAVVVVLLIAAFVCYTMNNNDKMQKEVGGESVEMKSDKRTPGLNA